MTTLHLVRSAAYAEGRILTLEEVRERMEAPPPEAVPWVVRTLVPRREVKVMHQHWHPARLLGAALLGVPVDRVQCTRADAVSITDKAESLSGNGAA